MSKYDDRLKDYVDVKERIRLFYEAHPDGRLVTAEVLPSTEPDDVPRIWVKALAYRTADDPLPGTGWSWLGLPGATPYTKGSEIENAETSAWGRAIGSLGIGIANSIASADEVRSKEVRADVEHGDDGSLIGIAQVGDRNTSDYLLRQTPEGSALGFRLRGDKGGILVEALGHAGRTSSWHTRTPCRQARDGVGPASANEASPREARQRQARDVPGARRRTRQRPRDLPDMPYDATPEPSAAPGPDLAGTEPPEDVPLLSEAPSAALFDELEEIGA